MTVPASTVASGPLAYPFVFTDESGVVAHDVSQPYYGIGMLKINDVGPWNDGINRILDRMCSKLMVPGAPAKRGNYEFRFSSVTKQTVGFHEELLDFFLAQPDGYFCGMIVDKTVPGIEPIAVMGSTWKAVIHYSALLIRKNLADNERAIVIADNFQKPRSSPLYYEREVLNRIGKKAVNAAMMESHSSVLLQLVDVLLGSVIYDFKYPRIAQPDEEKMRLMKHLRAGYRVKTFTEGKTYRRPNYFSVWILKPNHLLLPP